MKKTILIYDLPTRAFHWIFALLILLAATIAQTIDDDDGRFGYHMLCGMTLFLLVVLRLLWGFVGTHYARFSSFALKPTDAVNYAKNVLNPNAHVWSGHNPASSWAALAMMGLVLLLGMTGFGMVTGSDKFVLKDVHEILAYGLMVLIGLHLGGLLLHSLVYRDELMTSMVSGNKLLPLASSSDRKIKSHGPVAVAMALVVAGFLYHLWSQYHVESGILNLFGDNLQLIEDVEDSEESETDD